MREKKKEKKWDKNAGSTRKTETTHVDEYKNEHTIKLDRVYADMYVDREIYPLIINYWVWVANNTKHCKFWASIFYFHTIMHKAKESTKSEKHSLIRIILWGPEKIEDTVWESLIGKCKDIKERWIDL